MTAPRFLQPAPDAPRAVRLVPMMDCPVCGNLVLHASTRSGETWVNCRSKHRENRGACHGHWLDLTLAPGTTAGDVLAAHGPAAARAILKRIRPERAQLPAAELWATVLVEAGADQPWHLQILASRRTEYLLRHASLEQILASLRLL